MPSATPSEYIRAAALMIKDRVYSLPAPARHAHVMRWIVIAVGSEAVMRADQGFVTSTGRFVERVEAGEIAVACGQVEKLNWPDNLYSEDLW
jgi:hypothetical protein